MPSPGELRASQAETGKMMKVIDQNTDASIKRADHAIKKVQDPVERKEVKAASLALKDTASRADELSKQYGSHPAPNQVPLTGGNFVAAKSAEAPSKVTAMPPGGDEQ